MTDEEKLSAINETIKNLKDDKKGLSSLLNSIWGALSPEEQQKLKTIRATKPYYAEERFNLFVARKIQEYEENEKNGKKSDGFRQDILDNVRKSIAEIENPQPNNIFIQSTAGYNNIREQLNATPEVFMKYGISTSCSNAAGAFVHEFIKTVENILKSKNLTKEEIKAEIDNIKKNDIIFLATTKYTNLIDGRAGHVVPCVKLNTNNWVMIEARNETIQENVFTKEIPDSDMVVGKSFEHLIKGHEDVPYIIKDISSENCTNHEDFLEHRSRVKLDDAQTFLAQVAEEKCWSPGMRKKIKRELDILSNLSEEDKKLLPEFPEELQRKIERERGIQSLRLATEELGKQVQHGPYVSMDELKKAQAQQAYLGID
ncbi:MAG: hypothetical protein IKL14_01680 [Alphaproteobacteria bacterium]|nr:hypothetical protein [Alphaproteobacteria bacterium]